MQELLARTGVSPEAIDRFRYRELEDATPVGNTVWRAGAVFILSVDFAKQEDIARSLATVSWNLLVVLEAHLLRGLRERLIWQLLDSSPDLRMVLATTPSVDDIPTFGIEPFTKTRWRRSEVTDHTGKRLLVGPPPQLEIVEFQKEDPERELQRAVEELAHLIQTADSAVSLGGPLFLRALESSPAALEERVRWFRNRLAHGILKLILADSEEGEETGIDFSSVASENREKLFVTLEKCLTELESFTVDSKLNALVNKLKALWTGPGVPTAMCILTEYRATLFYLQTKLGEMGLKAYVLHGSMSLDERVRNVQEFRQHGGILLATTAMGATGLNLPQVESLILYDLPRSPLILEQIYGRFQRFGRTVPLKLSVLYDSDKVDSASAVILDRLRIMVAEEAR